MLLLAHVGYTTGGGWLAQRLRLKNPLDFRLLALMALLPDIVDRGLYVLFLPDAQSGRLIAHTLVFELTLLAILILLRRGLWIYGLAALLHLAMDVPGLAPEQALWPFLGPALEKVQLSGAGEAAGLPFTERVVDRFQEVASTYSHADLRGYLLDAGGMAVLALLAVKAKLYRGPALILLARHGCIPAGQREGDPPNVVGTGRSRRGG